MDKYEYLTGEEILFHDQRRVIEQAAFAYSPLGQAFERKKKNRKIEGQGKNKLKL